MRGHYLGAIFLAALPYALAQDVVSFNNETYANVSGSPYQTFRSNTDLRPPEFLINRNSSEIATGLVFISVQGKPSSEQNFPGIYEFAGDRMGSLVWSTTNSDFFDAFDFRMQTYRGEPTLTFWAGELMSGWGLGSFYLLNQSYAEITHFSPVGHDDGGDIHEFVITADDTALVAIYPIVQANLTGVGGAEDGWIFDGTFQEIDIETGDLLFEWNASSHVAINETYGNLDDNGSEDSPFDYFHINSVDKDANGDYLISARLTHCIYKISGEDGSIIWRMNGRASDFDMDEDAVFAWQHDARWINSSEQTRMTLFDNGPTDNFEYSRGLLVDVDQEAMTVTLLQDFANLNRTFGQFKGSTQAIDPANESTNYFVGFGSQPYFAEFDSEGNILLDVQYGIGNAANGYRAYRLPWQGMPITVPDIHYDRNASEVFFSWNGATEVEEWMVYTANETNTTSWNNVTTVRRSGFETVVDLSDLELETFIRGKAINSTGDTLGWTRAGNGNDYFDAPEGVETTSTTSTTPSATISPPASSVTDASGSETTGAAVRAKQGWSEQAYIAAVVVVGGLVV
ncbi:hypothetical protein EJ04DRAFT_512544 [Polyplosphaeria fusca]|uniref:ASST-domain-containing protein n=1 Tax=Polyplosphaeria fusca TaxID=682080 RepID=A0A9P4R0U7_9PLEO|nr:hypothetical protein EJ04DRAFT_512544 [Polyplosphaeria fusca]